MAVVHYDDGTLYGDADAFYGRIDADLSAAQETHTRETGLKVKIIDENVNQWEYFTGSFTWVGSLGTRDSTSQDYAHYRGHSGICKLGNGDIVRVRVHPETRDVEYQVITDPTVAAQWTTWTSYDTDDNYSVAVAPDTASTYIIYHIKAAGLYRNKSLVWSKDNLFQVTCHRDANGNAQKDSLWIRRTSDGIIHPDTGFPLRKIDVYVTEDILTVTPDFVDWNYIWVRHSVGSITRSDGKLIRITSSPQYSSIEANIKNTGESLVSSIANGWSEMDDVLSPRLIRGLPGTYGRKGISGIVLTKIGEFYYLFYAESQIGEDFESISNVRIPTVWQRSKDGEHWSEPVLIPFDIHGLSGVIADGDWVYLVGNELVYRRPLAAVEYDISDYVPQTEWDAPRDNQTGTGSVMVANPDGINDYLLDLNGKRIVLEPGMRVPETGGYEFAQLEDHWISRIEEQREGDTSRLQIHISNLWGKLENPLRDVYTFIGFTEFEDFGVGRKNELFQYFFENTEEDPVITDDRLVLSGGGTALWTAWKGYNPFVQIRRSGEFPMSIVYRWVDADNHMKVQYDGDKVRLYEVVEGTATQVGPTRTIGSVQNWGIRVIWKTCQLWVNGAFDSHLSQPTTQDTPNVVKPGYTGFQCAKNYTVWDFRFEDLEHDFTANQLIRQALALGDYHDAIVSSSDDRQYALTWGPQTDIPTAADALRNFLEADKLDLVWRDGIITVGKFKDTTAVKTIEDRIIRTDYSGEDAKHINVAQVDGNEHTWLEVDDDILDRDRSVNAYLDVPELIELDSVKERALEEIRRSKMGLSPGGTVPLFFDLWRMDPVQWVDNAGVSRLVRIEGMRVLINQSDQPSQRQELDTSLINE